MDQNSLNHQFVELYKKLDYIKDHNPDIFNRFKERYGVIDSFRNMRNVLCHVDNPGEVSEGFYNQLKNMISIMTTKVENIYTKTIKLYYASMNSSLDEILDKMDAMNFSFVPILDDGGHILGVISEKTILSILEKDTDCIHTGKKVSECMSYFKLDNNPNYFYAFVGRNELAIDTKDMFADERNGKRCGLAFITESGKSSETVLGIVNAWDLLKI